MVLIVRQLELIIFDNENDTDSENVADTSDIPVDMIMCSQGEVDQFLASGGWTAFKYTEDAWEHTPTVVDHFLRFQHKSGKQRPKVGKLTDVGWELTSKYATAAYGLVGYSYE